MSIEGTSARWSRHTALAGALLMLLAAMPQVHAAEGSRGVRVRAAPAPAPALQPAAARVAAPAPAVAAPAVAAYAAVRVALESPDGDDGMRETVRAALAAASTQRREAQKLTGEEREQALRDVTARYAAIAEDGSFAVAGRAEAAFRTGELLRSSKHLDEAEVMYVRATELGTGVEGGEEFAARGLLEAAHLKRRAHDVAAALTLYAAVRERFPEQKRSAAHAVTWMGKLQLASDQREQGIATLLSFREQFPEYPAEAVRDADLVALEQLEAGDETGARRTVDDIRLAMEGVIAGGGKQAESVTKALAAMRVTEQLAGY